MTIARLVACAAAVVRLGTAAVEEARPGRVRSLAVEVGVTGTPPPAEPVLTGDRGPRPPGGGAVPRRLGGRAYETQEEPHRYGSRSITLHSRADR